MNNLNSVIIEGNVVRQGELSEPLSGFKVCKFPIAVNRWYKNSKNEGVKEVSFFDVESYGKIAEESSRKTLKGIGVRVVGRLKQSKWENADGKQQSRVLVIADHIEYIPKLAGKTGSAQEPEEDAYTEEAEAF